MQADSRAAPARRRFRPAALPGRCGDAGGGMTSFWIACQGEDLEQGDYLPGCWIPVVGADFDPATAAEPEITVGRCNLIIVTQSCDLANDKIQLAALCPIAD